MSAPPIDAEGVTNPSIDDLLTKTDSKYKLVLYSAKRARQINAYYSQLGGIRNTKSASGMVSRTWRAPWRSISSSAGRPSASA